MQKGGESLKSYIANLNLSFDEVLTISSQIANGLKCLHSLGIIHRDIKLENIVHTSNEFRLIDFGLSTIISSSESTLDSYGTITYMSPEIIKKEKYNNKADIWSFGVVVYILLKNVFPSAKIAIMKSAYVTQRIHQLLILCTISSTVLLI